MSSERDVTELTSRMRGRVVTPSDADYDRERAVYNAMIDRRPAVIAQCVDAADVMAAIGFSRDADLEVAIRGGGHSGPGLGTVEDGLVVDLRRMRGVRVDPATRRVRAGGGCVFGDLDHATYPFGLAVPGGFVSSTGVGGLTLGGGVGYLARRFGLTIDSLVSADVVLADGSFVVASNSEIADLFWALRGGGGNFGVVTAFEFQLHPVAMVHGGPMIWPLDRAAELLRLWRDIVFSAPEELNGFFAFMKVPPGPPFPAEFHGRTMCAVVWCDTGPAAEATQRLESIRKDFGKPAIDFAGPIPWPALQSLFDPMLPPGLQWYWKSDFFSELDDETIDLEVRHGSEVPTLLSTTHLYPIDGAVRLVGAEDTAFAYRDARFVQMTAGADPDPANNDRMITWARRLWEALHPFSAGGGYVNMSMDEGQELVRAAYRGNYRRLAEVKRRYDPDNLFHVNQNIRPAD